MWRANGVGELYLYFPKSNQVPDFSHWEKSQHNVDIDTNGDYGVSFRNSHFVYRRNHWTTMRQRVHLNSVRSSGHGNPDGWLAVWFDGAHSPTFNITNVVLRKYSDVHIDGIYFSTFFGGHDSSWATPHDTYTLFRNFHVKVN
ncbi:hypothetical protein FSP39_016821 [Pinctada imbricata]|uniref:Polysaccharide lyase 14 domain-containing protein n=1 Tax=Pinctada imbricata TaxID=66713 RepID=A0AA88YD71_PINIB|nr:hypothetical protein FSP39_016821 [Pinctada imbricata]